MCAFGPLCKRTVIVDNESNLDKGDYTISICLYKPNWSLNCEISGKLGAYVRFITKAKHFSK